MVQTNLNFDSGSNLRNSGMEKALLNNESWKEKVLEQIRALAKEQETFTSDDIRIRCDHLLPTSGKAWGGVIGAASKLRIIKKTGKYVQSCITTNHARPNAEWTRA